MGPLSDLFNLVTFLRAARFGPAGFLAPPDPIGGGTMRDPLIRDNPDDWVRRDPLEERTPNEGTILDTFPEVKLGPAINITPEKLPIFAGVRDDGVIADPIVTPKRPTDFIKTGTPITSRIGIATDDIQGLEPGPSGGAVRRTLPELFDLAKQAGVEFLKPPSVGRGFWTEDRPGEPPEVFDDKDLDLPVRGEKAAIEWLAASAAKAWNQRAVMVAHDTPEGQHPIGQIDLEGLTPADADELSAILRDHLPGWHIGWRRGKGRATLVIASDQPDDDGLFAARMRTIVDQLSAAGAAVNDLRARKAEVKFLGSDAYDQIIGGGPRGG